MIDKLQDLADRLDQRAATARDAAMFERAGAWEDAADMIRELAAGASEVGYVILNRDGQQVDGMYDLPEDANDAALWEQRFNSEAGPYRVCAVVHCARKIDGPSIQRTNDMTEEQAERLIAAIEQMTSSPKKE